MTRQDGSDKEIMSDIFAQYAPPFDLTSDMLFVSALCPSTPLRRTFTEVPFLSFLGRTPRLIWFSRVTEMRYAE